jgi:hypothetical protein
MEYPELHSMINSLMADQKINKNNESFLP